MPQAMKCILSREAQLQWSSDDEETDTGEGIKGAWKTYRQTNRSEDCRLIEHCIQKRLWVPGNQYLPKIESQITEVTFPKSAILWW